MTSLALDFVTVKGFKSIASIEKLALSPVNVLIGANGSGKSNFIEVFSFLHAMREGRLQKYVRRAGGAEQLLHFGSKTTKEIEILISFREQVNQYRIVLRPTDDDSLYPEDERTYFWDKTKYRQPYDDPLVPRDDGREAGISNPGSKAIASWVRHRLGMWRVYHVHDTSPSSPMRKTAQLNDNDYLRPDGSNLPSFLYLLKHKHPEQYGLIVRTVRRVAPFFDDFQLRPDRLNKETIRLAWKHKNSEQYFGPSALSDGTLRFIALASLLLQPEELRPSVILVDEPELGLHPYAIELLASLVKQASAKTQVILSTQSALLLDHFDPDQVLVADRVGASTTLKRLDPAPLAQWLEEYSLGQLWEKNELGGAPWIAQFLMRLLNHVEGITEETFSNEVLAPHLLASGYESVGARLIGNARLRSHRGGTRAWTDVKRDIARHLKSDQGAVATTMVDYYGLPASGPKEWPGRALANQQQFAEKAQTVQDALLRDVVLEMGGNFDPKRFIPFVVMHEFEGLLFSDCDTFAEAIGQKKLASDFHEIRAQFDTPEEINDSPVTAPSKRIRLLLPAYDKPLLANVAALEIGLEKIREQCPQFGRWLTTLEGLP